MARTTSPKVRAIAAVCPTLTGGPPSNSDKAALIQTESTIFRTTPATPFRWPYGPCNKERCGGDDNKDEDEEEEEEEEDEEEDEDEEEEGGTLFLRGLARSRTRTAPHRTSLQMKKNVPWSTHAAI